MRTKLYPPLTAAIAVLLALSGCGGGGLGSSGASLSLSRSKPVIAYGESVTVSWNSNKVEEIVESKTNLALDFDDTSGSISDKPAFDTTYTITARTEDNEEITRSVSVQVAKSAKKIVVVADQASTGVSQIRDYVQGLTEQPVTVSLGLPNLSAVDALVVHESANIAPAQQSAVKSFLDSGKGVLLIGRAVRKLASGNINQDSTSAISSWFGGTTSVSTNSIGNVYYVASSPSGVPLSNVAFGDRAPYPSVIGCYGTSAQAVWLSGTAHSACVAFAYKPSSGGRAAYAGGVPTGNPEDETAARTVFLSLVRWAADGS